MNTAHAYIFYCLRISLPRTGTRLMSVRNKLQYIDESELLADVVAVGEGVAVGELVGKTQFHRRAPQLQQCLSE